MLTITSHARSDRGRYVIEHNHDEVNNLDEFSKELMRLVKGKGEYKTKKTIFVTARIHPGETCSSLMMHGFLKHITSNTPSAEALRNCIIFKVIPMINIDGVIVGNYRSGLSGQDLNRKFWNPDSRLHPEVCAIKKLLREYTQGEVLAYIDMHSHSKKKCVFIYGPHYPLHSIRYIKVRVFAKLMAQRTRMFRYRACKYRQEPAKRSAARLVISREFGIMNSLTLETSFHGFISEGARRQITIEFSKEMYEKMGEHCANTINDYLQLLREEHLQKLTRIVTRKMQKKNQAMIKNKNTESLTKISSRNTNDVLDKIILLKKPTLDIQQPVLRIEDSYKKPELLKEKEMIIPKKLCEIYESIKDDIEKKSKDDPESENESDSNSSSNEEDTQRKQEEETAIKDILFALQGETNNEIKTPKAISSANCEKTIVAVGNKIGIRRRNSKILILAETEYPHKLVKRKLKSSLKMRNDSDRLKNKRITDKEFRKIHRMYQENSQNSPKRIARRTPNTIIEQRIGKKEKKKVSNSMIKNKGDTLTQRRKELSPKKVVSRGIDSKYSSHLHSEFLDPQGHPPRSSELRKNLRTKFPNHLKFIPSIQEKCETNLEDQRPISVNRSCVPQRIKMRLHDGEVAGIKQK